MIFGKKDKFAIEVKKTTISCDIEVTEATTSYDKVLMPLIIWLNANPVGTFEDWTYIPVFIGRLKRAINTPIKLPDKIEKCKIPKIFNYLNNSDIASQYSLGLGDSFDDYYMYFYHIEDDIFLIAKLKRITVFEYKEKGENNIHFLCINKYVLEKIVLEFERMLNMD